MSGTEARSPHLSAEQLKASRQKFPPVPAVCVVTGGTGFVGSRLVEMLVERGAKKVRVLDVVPPGPLCWQDPRIEYTVGSICDAALVAKVVDGADCVWHMAAAVGPFHPKPLYRQVNYEGTMTVVAACRAKGVHKIVMSSSPSTRFDGSDVDGLTEAQMPPLPQKRYLQPYAETKAEAEVACMAACEPPELMTVAVAPHQVYGPRDNLFLPNMLETAGTGRLRIFGKGRNRICFTHNDNYCHGLILAERVLYEGSPALGKFYIITDAHTHPYEQGYLYFWEEVDKAVVGVGFPSMYSKLHYPIWLLWPLACLCDLIGYLFNIQIKLNRFNIIVLTMHRWFDVSAAQRDLKYEPIIPYSVGWPETIAWFKQHWLPGFRERHDTSLLGIAKASQAKIDVQSDGTMKKQL